MRKKCFKCKKPVGATSQSAITFYSISSPDKNEEEYEFCGEFCLDAFFRDRIQFNAIVRDFKKDKP